MTPITTFYFNRIRGAALKDNSGKKIGIIKDLLAENLQIDVWTNRPVVKGIVVKTGTEKKIYDFSVIGLSKESGHLTITLNKEKHLDEESIKRCYALEEAILNKQIVDLNGSKLVKVNDLRLVSLPSATFVVAVEIGMEGTLRRIGVVKWAKSISSLLHFTIPSRFILWEDVEAIDFNNLKIRLSENFSRLHTLHPSDLADIIEDLGKRGMTELFSALDEERAADVLEELEPEAQLQIIESLPVHKMADVLEKMPADEVADILDSMDSHQAEKLLNEMEPDSSMEVRELLGYAKNTAGSLMTVDFLEFRPTDIIESVLTYIETYKPEHQELYSMFVTDSEHHLKGTFSLRDLLINPKDKPLSEIMHSVKFSLMDEERVSEIAEGISKYNLLAVPVTDEEGALQGMIVIDDVLDDLMSDRTTNK